MTGQNPPTQGIRRLLVGLHTPGGLSGQISTLVSEGGDSSASVWAFVGRSLTVLDTISGNAFDHDG